MQNYLKLAKHLFNTNKELVKRTAIRDCHCLGLNSFIINESPKIRLFVAEVNSELHKFGSIPIHSHKYDDLFFTIKGKIKHYIYRESFSALSKEYNCYIYPRIDDRNRNPTLIGTKFLQYCGTISDSALFLNSQKLHTITVEGNRVMWLVTELDENVNFDQVCYTESLKIRLELYKPFEDPIDYLEQVFEDEEE